MGNRANARGKSGGRIEGGQVSCLQPHAVTLEHVENFLRGVYEGGFLAPADRPNLLAREARLLCELRVGEVQFLHRIVEGGRHDDGM